MAMNDGPVRILIHDKRLHGKTPTGQFDDHLEIGSKTSLGRILNWIAVAGNRFGFIDELHLWAHGIESGGSGGLGVMFGADGINLHNVHRWAAVQGWVEWIQLLACKAADNSGSGQGSSLCSQLAAFSGAWVTASMDRQIYTTNVLGEIQMDDWEGDVFSWDPWGCQSNVTFV
jgi:hypothetical protein